MSDDLDEDEDAQPGFFRKYRVAISITLALVLGVGIWLFRPSGEKPKKRTSSANIVNVMPTLPPPPPPTPPPTPPPQEPQDRPEEVVETQQEFVEETQPDSAPEQDSAPPEDAAPMGTNIEGDGPDNFGLTGKGGGALIGGTGAGTLQRGGSRFGHYAGQVQSRVAGALRTHKRTRSASLNLKVRIWVDSGGRITRAALEGSSGNSAVDQAITNEILSGLQLSQPPPEDMPMPIVMRISARKPN